MSDIEILEKLEEKAKNRDLGVDSVNYYYALKHAIELMKNEEKEELLEDIDTHVDSTEEQKEDLRKLLVSLSEDKVIPEIKFNQKWISVKDGYPNDCEEVIITDGEDYAIGSYREDADAWEHANYGWLERESEDEHPIRLGKVTHWTRFKKFESE